MSTRRVGAKTSERSYSYWSFLCVTSVLMTPAFSVKETPSPSVQLDPEDGAMLDPAPRVACGSVRARITNYSLRIVRYTTSRHEVASWREGGVRRKC